MKKAHKVHGRVEDGILVKDGKKVVKFWKHNGYGIDIDDLTGGVNGVVLETQYDGKLYSSVSNLFENGIRHDFQGEKQIILPLEFWRGVK